MQDAPTLVLAVFVLFCRVGAMMMLMPGVSSARIPVQVRLLVAVAVTLALSPLLVPTVRPSVAGADVVTLARLIAGELLVGTLIGLLARIFFSALQAMTAVVASAIGFGGMVGVAVEGDEPQPAMVSLIGLTAVVLMFQAGVHWELLRGLVASYAVLPPDSGFDTAFALGQVLDRLADTFLLTLRICSPFIVYAMLMNFIVGITNKLVPNIMVYFVALPLTLIGGLFLLYFHIDELLALFTTGFALWAAGG